MIRTKACKTCGEVIFNINSTCENVELVCKSCNSITNVNFGKYLTLDKVCNSCSNDSFKIKVEDNRNRENTYIECTDCKGAPNHYYVDYDGNVIDRISREMLIIQDSINTIHKDVSNIEARVSIIENNIKNVKSNLSKKVNENKVDINSINYEMNSFSSELSKVKDMIDNIEGRIISSLYLFK